MKVKKAPSEWSLGSWCTASYNRAVVLGLNLVWVGRPISPYYYKKYYKNACSECMPAIPIVVPI